MAVRNRAFLTAFRALVASLGLLSLLMLALQAFPQFRLQTRLVAASLGLRSAPNPVNESQESDSDRDSALVDPFSGSVSGSEIPAVNDEYPQPTPIATSAPGTVIFQDASPRPADETAATPYVALQSIADAAAAAVRVESNRWESRLSDLERRYADLQHKQSPAEDPVRERLTKVLDQCESQFAELKTTHQRLEGIEKQFIALQETLAAQKTTEAPSAEADDSVPPPQRISIRTELVSGESQLMIEARDASLSELFARLGEASGMNLLVAPSIAGNVSLHLRVANFVEALQAVCRIHHCRHVQDGSFIVITREESTPAAPRREPQEMMTKLYRLQYLSGSEIRPYVSAVLTPGVGTISFASIRERIARKEYRDPPRAILVKDTPTVLGEVDRLILELDQPATPRGKPYNIGKARQLIPALPVAAPTVTPYVPPPPVDESATSGAPSGPFEPPVQAPQVVPEAAECEIFEAPIVIPGATPAY